MRAVVIAAFLAAVALEPVEAAAAPIAKDASASTEISAQARRPPTRFRV